MEILKAQAN